MLFQAMNRTRTNQPTGWKGKKPSCYHGVTHSYVYYPSDWFDETTSRGYRKGYYDENGTYYDTVVFKQNGKYENVICRCEYCGSVRKMDWSGDGQAPNCENCGAVMKIESAIDELITDSASSYDSSFGEVNSSRPTVGKTALMTIITAIIFISVMAISTVYSHISDLTSRYPSVVDDRYGEYEGEEYDGLYALNHVDLFGETLYLKYSSPSGNYTIVDGDDVWDKALPWDEEFESYYDERSDCYLWYNTEVYPYVWQYWYEDFSSQYGDYGWMEHDEDGWWVEEESERWIELPDEYDEGVFWYILED